MISCNTKVERKELKTLDFKVFKITIPKDWDTTKLKSIDSFGAAIITSTNDTINIDYGAYSEKFEDVSFLHPYSLKLKLDSLHEKYPEGIIFSKNYMLDLNQGAFLNEYYFYDSIDGFRAKFMMPKKMETGRYGIHFDSLNGENFGLTIVGKNIDSTQHLAVYKAFKSLKFQR